MILKHTRNHQPLGLFCFQKRLPIIKWERKALGSQVSGIFTVLLLKTLIFKLASFLLLSVHKISALDLTRVSRGTSKTEAASRLQRLMRLWWLETWSLISLGQMFLTLPISYLELLKLPRSCLCFWLPCQKTHTSVPHHITDQCLVMRGGAERLHRKMAAKTVLPPIQREHREQSGFDQPLPWENMEYAGMYMNKELVSGVHHDYYLQTYLLNICSCLWAWQSLYGTTLPLKWAPESTLSTALAQMRKDKCLS